MVCSAAAVLIGLGVTRWFVPRSPNSGPSGAFQSVSNPKEKTL